MASQVVTLFGEEEMVPEELSAAPKNPPREGEQPANMIADWKLEKQYYTIGEVAKLFGVRTSHIRYWTTEFDINVRTTRKGDRLYPPAAIRELREIYLLVKERRFTIAGAKAHRQSGAVPAQTADLVQALLRLRNQLLLIRNELL